MVALATLFLSSVMSDKEYLLPSWVWLTYLVDTSLCTILVFHQVWGQKGLVRPLDICCGLFFLRVTFCEDICFVLLIGMPILGKWVPRVEWLRLWVRSHGRRFVFGPAFLLFHSQTIPCTANTALVILLVVLPPASWIWSFLSFWPPHQKPPSRPIQTCRRCLHLVHVPHIWRVRNTIFQGFRHFLSDARGATNCMGWSYHVCLGAQSRRRWYFYGHWYRFPIELDVNSIFLVWRIPRHWIRLF